MAEGHGGLEGLVVLENYLPLEVQEAVWKYVYSQEWKKVSGRGSNGRRVQHYGYAYNYQSRSVKYLGPMPDCLSELIRRCLPDEEWDQCLVNEYTAGQGIAWHTDAACFGPKIVSMSFGSPATMQFKLGGAKTEAVLRPGSVCIMTGAARRQAQHCIPGMPKGARRVSLTFRSVPKAGT